MQVAQIHSLEQVSAADWNRLAGGDYPFTRHEFLLALEQSLSVCAATGWQPAHLLVSQDQELVVALPLYLKQHSWGEYVFDHQWAAAYKQHGCAYYPKLLTAIPLTPCQGQRLLIKAGLDPAAVMTLLLTHIKQLAEQADISSWHCLFPDAQQLAILQSLGLNIREGVQFQWFNQGYGSFEDFLQSLSASKRKMLKRERRRVDEQGIRLLRLLGPDITEQQWQVFYQFYTMTYLKRGSEPYLNLAFFQQIAKTMPEQILLVLAIKENDYVGAALSFIGSDCLYGRYWGCFEEYHVLHFEACYYQGLDYCIEHGLSRFDSGAQGEHKISRGFQPITTYSAHWLKDTRFAAAIAQFLAKERLGMQQYKQDAETYLPFKKNQWGQCG